MKKKDQNQIDKKKNPINTQKEKVEDKKKDIKMNPPLSAHEKHGLPIHSSNNPKTKKNNNNLTDLSSQALTRKKSEQKYNVNHKMLEEKNIKKEKGRVFSHSPEHLLKQNNQKSNMNKPKNIYPKNLTERNLKIKQLSVNHLLLSLCCIVLEAWTIPTVTLIINLFIFWYRHQEA